MNDTSNRTFVCSVLFLDIVEYSKKPVTEQLSLKQRFNAMLIGAMRHVATADRIVLDTGDGAAVSFLGNPEDCLFAAMGLRDAIMAEGPQVHPPLQVRIGINLGPVRLIKDINGQLNIIGDGINVAQRVMSFAEPGHILVSRSYFEVVSCLSDDFARLFQYDGTRTDKHVREHSVYSVGQGTLRPPANLPAEGRATTEAVTANTPSSLSMMTGRKPLVAAVLVAAGLIGGALILRMERPAPVAKAPVPAATAEKPAAGPILPVTLAIAPWGEVYVDGQLMGVSPPLQTLTLAAGKHRIEIRNTTLPPHVETIEVGGGKNIRIQHKF